MREETIKALATELQLKPELINQVLQLLAEGNTVHFLARYRKEQIDGIDETRIREIEKRYQYQQQLLKRKERIKGRIAEQEMLSSELVETIDGCTKLVQLDQLYEPYKSKKITKAKLAIQGGLEPFAKQIFTKQKDLSLRTEAKNYINELFLDEDEVLENTMYLVAQMMSETLDFREQIKQLFEQQGQLVTKAKKNIDTLDLNRVYENYYQFSRNINQLVNHQVLAINRAEKAKFLQMKLVVDEAVVLKLGKQYFTRACAHKDVTAFIVRALEDAYKRLLFPSIGREIRADLTLKAETDAIALFGANVYQLFMQQPLVKQTVLGFDPAFRSGCKLAVINGNGDVKAIDVIYPHAPQCKRTQAKEVLNRLYDQHQFTIIALGNGTASSESEVFIAEWIQKEQKNIQYALISETGASVYSASKQAIAEFPTYSVELRSAVSIARRLLDPLSELVKIDPKALGVGQYQHDLNANALDEALRDVVDQAVNTVGVDVNIASSELLQYVSGLNKTVAQNIVAYRTTHGNYRTREALKKVKGFGAKAFEQAAGFLRILASDEVFDNTNIHPESYIVAERILGALALEKTAIGTDEGKAQIQTLRPSLQSKNFGIDKYTLTQILDAFMYPLRDESEQFAASRLKSHITTLEDLAIGMEFEGVVRNITDFGAFIDVGLKNDGFVHVSKIADHFIKHPSAVLRIGEQRKVYIENIHHDKQQVELTLLQREK